MASPTLYSWSNDSLSWSPNVGISMTTVVGSTTVTNASGTTVYWQSGEQHGSFDDGIGLTCEQRGVIAYWYFTASPGGGGVPEATLCVEASSAG